MLLFFFHFYLIFIPILRKNLLLLADHWKSGFFLKQLTTLLLGNSVLFYLFPFANSKPFQNHSNFTNNQDIQKMPSFGLCCTRELKHLEMLQQHNRLSGRLRAWLLLWNWWSQPCPWWQLHQPRDAGIASWREFCLLILINKGTASWQRVVLLAVALADGCFFNNLFAVTVLRICRSAMWQVFWDGTAWFF